MKRRSKEILSALMAVLMVVGMTGCEDEAHNEAHSIEEVWSDWRNEETVELSTKENSTDPEESTTPMIEPDGETAENDRVGTRPGADEGEIGNDSVMQDNDEISGLIIMTATAPLNAGTCEVISFNPESGETEVLSNFSFKNNSNVSYLWSDSAAGGYYQFDDTYTRMATRKFLSASGDEHAGWLTADGEFFDVTEAVGGARQSDFADSVHYSSMGFTDNGFFVFQVTNPNDRSAIDYYSVPISDVSVDTMQKCCAISYSGFAIDSYDEYYDLFWPYGTPSSWIDNTHCVLTPKRSSPGNPVTSVIFNTEDMTSVNYIPGDSRNNWNGQISPDGTQIAFVSVPRSENELPDIFIVPISGGEPVRVAGHDFTLTGIDTSFGMSTYDSCTMLVDWR